SRRDSNARTHRSARCCGSYHHRRQHLRLQRWPGPRGGGRCQEGSPPPGAHRGHGHRALPDRHHHRAPERQHPAHKLSTALDYSPVGQESTRSLVSCYSPKAMAKSSPLSCKVCNEKHLSNCPTCGTSICSLSGCFCPATFKLSCVSCKSIYSVVSPRKFSCPRCRA